MAIPKLALIPASQGTSLYSVLPANGVGDFAFTRAGSATRINSQGLIETVASGVSRLNYPLIDGVVNGCPSHLLEPQRSNLLPYSEDFSDAGWTKNGSSVVSGFASPSADSPLGAFKLVEDASTGEHRIVTTAFAVSNGTAHSQSYFVKYLNTQWIQINRGQEGVGYLNFDLINGVVGFTGGITNYKISVMSNGWYRISINYTVTGTYATAGISILKTNVNARYETYLGNGTSGVYIYAAQFEQGSYATSYIPTQGSAVSRSLSNMFSDDLNNLGLINDTEGVFYTEIKMPISSTRDLSAGGLVFGNTSVWAGTRAFEISKDTDGSFRIAKRDSGFNVLADIVAGVYYKIAFKWDSLNVYLYVNGSLVTTSTYTQTDFKYIITDNRDSQKFIKEIKLYNTALTDAELIALTS